MAHGQPFDIKLVEKPYGNKKRGKCVHVLIAPLAPAIHLMAPGYGESFTSCSAMVEFSFECQGSNCKIRPALGPGTIDHESSKLASLNGTLEVQLEAALK